MQKKNLVIISDLDDVIADTTRTFLKEVNKKYNIESKIQDLSDPELKNFSQRYNISNKELYDFYTELLCKEEFTQKVPEIKDASKSLEKIKNLRENTGIYIVTGRPEESKYLAEDWLNERKIYYDKIFLTDQKAANIDSDKVETKDDLIELLEKESDTIVFEDSPRLIPTTIRGVLSNDKDTLIVLFEMPWTKSYLTGKGIEKEVEQNSRIKFVKNWGQAYTFLNKNLRK